MGNGESKTETATAAEKEEWNHAEDQHEETERQFDDEMAANKKAANFAKSDPKTTESKGKPENSGKTAS